MCLQCLAPGPPRALSTEEALSFSKKEFLVSRRVGPLWGLRQGQPEIAHTRMLGSPRDAAPRARPRRDRANDARVRTSTQPAFPSKPALCGCSSAPAEGERERETEAWAPPSSGSRGETGTHQPYITQLPSTRDDDAPFAVDVTAPGFTKIWAYYCRLPRGLVASAPKNPTSWLGVTGFSPVRRLRRSTTCPRGNRGTFTDSCL